MLRVRNPTGLDLRGKRPYQELRRRIYLAVYGLAFVSLSFSLAISPFGVLETWAVPISNAVLAGVMATAILLTWRRVALPWVEFLTVSFIGLFFIYRLGLSMERGPPTLVGNAAVHPIMRWSPAFLILVFIVLEKRRAFAVALAYQGIILGMAAFRFLPPADANELNVFLQQFVFSVAVYLVMLYILADLKERYVSVGEQAASLHLQAHTDPVVGIRNRFSMTEFCETEIERVERYGNDLSVILFDIDHFKRINDRYGHDGGDKVLVAIAELTSEHLRKTDRLGRWGGDEFLLVAPNTTALAVQKVAERIRGSIENWESPYGRVTLSVGVAEYVPADTSETLVKRADEALYRAKSAGRNRVVVASAH